MENYIVKETNLTPGIDLNYEGGTVMLKGKSIPENSLEFYQPVYDWLDAYLEEPKNKTIVIIQLEYFNTSSSKCILDILKRVDKLDEEGNDVLIKWHYDEDDEDMMEAGEDYSDLLDSPFELIPIEE